jgi:hypothetical protein
MILGDKPLIFEVVLSQVFGDSLLVMQQVANVFQCFEGSLNAYLDKSLKIITLFDGFIVQHISRDEIQC